MIVAPPRVAPKWLTPEMVKKATPLDHLDVIARVRVRHIRLMLLLAVIRRAADDLREYAAMNCADDESETDRD